MENSNDVAEDRLTKMLEMARKCRKNNDDSNAEKYYDLVRMEDPENWEANFFSAYYSASDCVIANIGIAAQEYDNCISSVVEMLEKCPQNEIEEGIGLIVDTTLALAEQLVVASRKNHSVADLEDKNAMLAQLDANVGYLYDFGDELAGLAEKKNLSSCKAKIALLWKKGVEVQCFVANMTLLKSNRQPKVDQMTSYVNKIQAIDPSFVAPKLRSPVVTWVAAIIIIAALLAWIFLL